MSKHTETGVKGEKIAEKFLTGLGYKLVEKNWCFGKKEIDLIVLKDGLLIFVEVKTRSSYNFGFPEEAVDIRKQNYLKAAAEGYLEMFPEYVKIRFDIISILLFRGQVKEIIHFEDAFY